MKHKGIFFDKEPVKQYANPFKKSQIIGQWYNREMGYIDALYSPAPEPESVIAYNDVDFIVMMIRLSFKCSARIL